MQRLTPGQIVKFKLGDVHMPNIEEILSRMTPETELEGSITLMSDQGNEQAAFAVIEVKGILMPIIVPAAAINRPVQNADLAKVW